MNNLTYRLRVSIIVPNDKDLMLWRKPFLRALIAAGIEVMVIAPKSEYSEEVRGLGCKLTEVRISRKISAPWQELRTIWQLYRVNLRFRPCLVHHFTIKPNIYGEISALLAQVPISICSVTGLGYLWIEESIAARLLRYVVEPIYKWTLKMADIVIFLNDDDRARLGAQHSIVIAGEGVDLSEFYPSSVSDARKKELRNSLSLSQEYGIVMMIGRMLRHKGVIEFAEAARLVREKNPKCQFILIGPYDKQNPSCLKKSTIDGWEKRGLLRYLGERRDIRELISIADLLVLPSYREGVPVALMEGAAMGKALIATDVPGCREVVKDGVNGILVPPRNAAALSNAINSLLSDSLLREKYEIASRKIAEEGFSDKKAMNSVIKVYAKLLEANGFKIPEAFKK